METPMVKLAHSAPENIHHRTFKAYRGHHRAIEKIENNRTTKKMTLRMVDYTKYYPAELRNPKDVRYIVNIES